MGTGGEQRSTKKLKSTISYSINMQDVKGIEISDKLENVMYYKKKT